MSYYNERWGYPLPKPNPSPRRRGSESKKRYTTILLPKGNGPSTRITGKCATRTVYARSFDEAAKQRNIKDGRTLLVSDGSITKAYRAVPNPTVKQV